LFAIIQAAGWPIYSFSPVSIIAVALIIRKVHDPPQGEDRSGRFAGEGCSLHTRSKA